MDTEIHKPKVFISYSWSSQQHQELIKQWADQLISEGVEVIIDIYDFKEGQDKYSYMEKMIEDKTISHVLLMCDKDYAKKANERKAGVGIESQIISKEIYDKVDQSRFIPILCEYSEDGEPALPIFLQSRKFINFSSFEEVNKNWEQLIRVLFGKPLYPKPNLGKPPSYILENVSTPFNPSIIKFNVLKQALIQGKAGIKNFRNDFIETCLSYIDNYRMTEDPKVASIEKKVIEDYENLKTARDLIIDWVILESEITSQEEFINVLLGFLERLFEKKTKPMDIQFWNKLWTEAPAIFIYETFLYIIAALLKTNSYSILHDVLTYNYMLPETEVYKSGEFCSFHCFYYESTALSSLFDSEKNKRSFRPVIEIIKMHADRTDIPFLSLCEADLLILFMAIINPQGRWFPQTLYYVSMGYKFPFFTRASRHKDFLNLLIITGINNKNDLYKALDDGQKRLGVNTWELTFYRNPISEEFNLHKLDSVS